jgi:hypothetical protein
MDVLLVPTAQPGWTQWFLPGIRIRAKLYPAIGPAQTDFYLLVHEASSNIRQAYKEDVLGEGRRIPIK